MSERVRVINSYNFGLTYNDYYKLINSDDDYHILHQGTLDDLPTRIINSPQFQKTKHSGANISDYLLFIIDNYPYFPKEVAFLKSNMLKRHITEEVFNRRIQSRDFHHFTVKTNHLIQYILGNAVENLLHSRLLQVFFLRSLIIGTFVKQKKVYFFQK